MAILKKWIFFLKDFIKGFSLKISFKNANKICIKLFSLFEIRPSYEQLGNVFRVCSIDSESYQSDISDLDMDFRYFSKKSQNRLLKRICSLAQNIPLFLSRSSHMVKPLLELSKMDPGDALTYLLWSHIMSRSYFRIREKNFKFHFLCIFP